METESKNITARRLNALVKVRQFVQWFSQKEQKMLWDLPGNRRRYLKKTGRNESCPPAAAAANTRIAAGRDRRDSAEFARSGRFTDLPLYFSPGLVVMRHVRLSMQLKNPTTLEFSVG